MAEIGCEKKNVEIELSFEGFSKIQKLLISWCSVEIDKTDIFNVSYKLIVYI